MSDEIILLVEDNPDHAVLVQALLEYRSLARRVYVTQSVSEAKSYLLAEWPFDDPARSPRPCLVVLDHWLEDGTGLELLVWLRKFPELSGIPVIVFTSCRDREVRERALALGVKDFLVKPEGFEALGQAIEAIVRPGRKWKRKGEGNGEGRGSGSSGGC